MSKLKIIAWNVNSIRSLVNKINLNDFLEKNNPQIFCMSETKLSCPDIITKQSLKDDIKGYRFRYYNTCTAKKGYSGTAIWSKRKPINITYGIEVNELDDEGRVITLEFCNFFLIHVYTPNSGQVLQRLNYRIKKWDVAFWKYVEKLQKKKSIIVCGDLNVARYEIDIHDPKNNLKSAGFTKEERDSFNKYMDKLNLIDAFRKFYPNEKDHYTYWSYMRQARQKNKGWRIDYFLTSNELEKKIKNCKIHKDMQGSDHAPIEIGINL